jgi:hypothetical protein
VGKLFNPIPFTNYAFYIIVTALFVPYFGWRKCLGITLALATVAVILDIPFYFTLLKTWPSIYESIFGTIQTVTNNSAQQTQQILFTAKIMPFTPQVQSVMWSFLLQPAPGGTDEFMRSTMGNGVSEITLIISGLYLSVAEGFYAIMRVYKKVGVYRRITF